MIRHNRNDEESQLLLPSPLGQPPRPLLPLIERFFLLKPRHRWWAWHVTLVFLMILIYATIYTERDASGRIATLFVDSTKNLFQLVDDQQWRHTDDRGKPSSLVFPNPTVKSRTGFLSYLDFTRGKPINVSYDRRSFMLDSQRTLFLSGSMHPVRATKGTWSLALDEAVNNGLNMVTIYIMWSAHQPFGNHPMNWTLPMSPLQCEVGRTSNDEVDDNCGWTLSRALWAAAQRGLFIHIRLGPYVCAEYSYGGIPEWLPLEFPDMDMRRLNSQWMVTMRQYLKEVIGYLSEHKLFAFQGGPIVMAQIENELGDDGNDELSSHYGPLQQYADWCGEVAHELAPQVIWTMCNGLTAKDTIHTFNGNQGSEWLERHGDTGRIQVDQPALWTENEEGFQIWGEDPDKPTDYFWGRTASDLAYSAMKWFARGGTHVNYYMFFGGQNFGRMAAAGITQNYASDAMLCSSGQRHQPKFCHLQQLHRALASVAKSLVLSDSALFHNQTLMVILPNGTAVAGTEQIMFAYQQFGYDASEVIFVENNADESAKVQIPSARKGNVLSVMSPRSSILLLDGEVLFDSSTSGNPSYGTIRKFVENLDVISCSSKTEPIGVPPFSNKTFESNKPIEQTILLTNASITSDYAWYETSLEMLDHNLSSVTLFIETSQASGMILYINGRFVGASDMHNHKEGSATLSVFIGDVGIGRHRLAILSESFGYGNLIGRWGGSTRNKRKGIVGKVWLSAKSHSMNFSLVDGRTWWSSPGLNIDVAHGSIGMPSWSTVHFETPLYNSSSVGLYLEMRKGRGHIYLNGYNLGRYWDVMRGTRNEPSQRYYFLPPDLLATEGTLNELQWFDVFGSRCEGFSLVLSWIENGENGFQDEVAYPMACI